MYFPFFILHGWRKRSAIQPQTIYSEFPKKNPALFPELPKRTGLPKAPLAIVGVPRHRRGGGIPQAKPAELLTYSLFTIH